MMGSKFCTSKNTIDKNNDIETKNSKEMEKHDQLLVKELPLKKVEEIIMVEAKVEETAGKILETVNYNDTIPFIPPVSKGKVIKVYDGDTITIASKMPWDNSPFFRFSVRLNGIDCPEMRTKNVNEKKCAKLAKEMLSNNILDKIVTLKNVQLEKYGRILADVYIQDINVTDCLIKNHLAVEYHGGKKQCPDDWLEYYNKRNS
jgi:micrococcal nuclease